MNQIQVPMRDGVLLATTIRLPPKTGSYPVVLIRTPYNRRLVDDGDCTQRGMALVVQDTRGRYESEGEFYPFVHEENDGLDTLDWIAEQPWCNGKIGMLGASYLAAVQFAVAAPGHRCLAALNPRFMPGDIWQSAYYRDGAFSFALTFSWLCLEVGARTSRASDLPSHDVPSVLRHLPLETIDELLDCGVVKSYRDYVGHEARDEFWRAGNWRKNLHQVSTPMLLTAGWYDYYAGATLLDYQALPPSAQHRVLIGPWTHGINPTSQLGEIDFGPNALQENDSSTRWLECVLKGGDPKQFQEAPIRLFVMGANVWRDEWEWPLARTQFVKWFLHEGGALNTSTPQDEKCDHYVYDPADPVPTLGGNHSVGPYNPGLYEFALPGPYDQRATEAREDVLVYTSEALEADTEVTGPVILKLFASSSAPDTDFVARLCDVYPDNRSINITEGVIRARFRARNWDAPEFLEPGKVCEYSIDLQATSNVFKKGHRIRLQITSSNFPLWNRNLNTGEPLATGTEFRKAEQTIFHNAESLSHLVLPLVPCC